MMQLIMQSKFSLCHDWQSWSLTSGYGRKWQKGKAVKLRLFCHFSVSWRVIYCHLCNMHYNIM